MTEEYIGYIAFGIHMVGGKCQTVRHDYFLPLEILPEAVPALLITAGLHAAD